MQNPLPSVSVIIATYNWSAALRCAIRSVLFQTVQTFEILVIGDACSDDSEAVVASFKDPRIRWANLESHCGSQWGPNNLGLELAAADYVAYLGHDDIWYPTHLELCLRTIALAQADLVASVTVLYGPPGTHVRSVSGLFSEDTCSSTDFMPPSSILHRKSLIEKCGLWPDAATTVLPVDCEFINRAFASGARMRSTNELTVFKFNAAWRRDAYQHKSVSEQQTMLEQIATRADFRSAVLTDVLRAGAEGQLSYLKIPDNPTWAPGERSQQYRLFKGAAQAFAGKELSRLEERERFGLGDGFAGFEWHGEERGAGLAPFRWTGPSNISNVDLPVVVDRELLLSIHVVHAIDEITLRSAAISANGRPVATCNQALPDGTSVLIGNLHPDLPGSNSRGLRVTIQVATTKRPRELGINDDARLLGLAIDWIEVAPFPC